MDPTILVPGSSSRSLSLKHSMDRFFHGLPGSINNVCTSTLCSPSRTRFAVNSGLWSERRYLGTPRRTNKSLSRSSTFSLVSRLVTSIAKHSRLYSSMIVHIENAYPSLVRSATKSYSKRDPCVAIEVTHTIHPPTIITSFWAVSETLEVLPVFKDVRSACDLPANLPYVKEPLPADSHTYRTLSLVQPFD